VLPSGTGDDSATSHSGHVHAASEGLLGDAAAGDAGLAALPAVPVWTTPSSWIQHSVETPGRYEDSAPGYRRLWLSSSSGGEDGGDDGGVGGTTAGEVKSEVVRLALDVKVILTPPCIFHWQISIQNIQGGVRLSLVSAPRCDCGQMNWRRWAARYLWWSLPAACSTALYIRPYIRSGKQGCGCVHVWLWIVD
jgi:hypothetical protein